MFFLLRFWNSRGSTPPPPEYAPEPCYFNKKIRVFWLFIKWFKKRNLKLWQCPVSIYLFNSKSLKIINNLVNIPCCPCLYKLDKKTSRFALMMVDFLHCSLVDPYHFNLDPDIYFIFKKTFYKDLKRGKHLLPQQFWGRNGGKGKKRRTKKYIHNIYPLFPYLIYELDPQHFLYREEQMCQRFYSWQLWHILSQISFHSP